MRVELHSKPLKGLSFRDLELATIIDAIDFDKYDLLKLEKEKGYKSKVRALRIEEEMAKMEQEIIDSEGIKKLNKFK